MDDWFTIEQIDSQTFVISEYKHWEETHCYLLSGDESALLIDTGLGVSDIRKAVEHLTQLPVLVATTHVHWDHIGGHKGFENIAVFETEKEWLSKKFPLSLQTVKNALTKYPCEFPSDFNIDDYQIYQGEPDRLLSDGDCIDLGNRKIYVIHTPGHSPGHCCYYEPEKKYLYSGDLIYKGCLDVFYPSTDPYLFLQSIRRIQTYPVNRIFPGHHDLNIPPAITGEIEKAFSALEKEGKLVQGNGIFDFPEFQIHI